MSQLIEEQSFIPDTSYTDEHIQGDTGLAIIRRRPTGFLSDLEIDGQHHAIYELIANSLDEIALMASGTGLIQITLCLDKANGTYQVVISDNGRGIPLTKMYPAVTSPHWSGKFNSKAYGTSAGLYGLGMKAAAGTANRFRTISYRIGEGSGSLFVQRGVHNELIDLDMTHVHRRGVTCIWEPDPSIFQKILEYADGGFEVTLSLLKKYVFFRSYPVQFKLIDGPVDERVWSCSNKDMEIIVDSIHSRGHTVWEEATHDRDDWIRHYWNVQRPWAFRHRFSKVIKDTGGLEDYIVCINYAKFSEVGGRFGMVNNVPIDEARSDHFKVLNDQLVEYLSSRIHDKAIREFFVSSYRLPVHLAVDVKFEGAEFRGTTKEGFTSPIFRELYRTDLGIYFKSEEGKTLVDTLYGFLEQDIVQRFKQSQKLAASFKGNFRIFEALKFPDNHIPATTKDRSRAELFLVEGKSAGGSRKGVDPEIAGQYILGGKPLNAIRTGMTPDQIRREVLTKNDKKNWIYQDIFTIIGWDARNPGSASNYKNVFLLTDADVDGRHIASILIGNFYAIDPDLVNSGYFHIVTPPYYQVTFGSRGKADAKDRIFFRDEESVENWKIGFYYQVAFHIDLDRDGQVTRCNQTQFAAVARAVLRCGELMTTLSTEFSIPEIVIEQLATITAFLPEHGQPLLIPEHRLAQLLGADSVEYDPVSYILTVSCLGHDWVIPLHGMLFALRQKLVPIMNHIRRVVRYPDANRLPLEIYITTKHTDVYRRHPVTLWDLYANFKSLDEMLSFRTFKGLAGMQPEDKNITCINPGWRQSFQVREVGDVDVIFDLLGKDSDERKELSAASY